MMLCSDWMSSAALAIGGLGNWVNWRQTDTRTGVPIWNFPLEMGGWVSERQIHTYDFINFCRKHGQNYHYPKFCYILVYNCINNVRDFVIFHDTWLISRKLDCNPGNEKCLDYDIVNLQGDVTDMV